MEQAPHNGKHKGGRPRKPERKDQLIALKCSPAERHIIEEKAKSAHLTTSEYLREIALTGKIVSHQKKIPGEVLALTGALNNNGALLNQIARSRNNDQILTKKQQAELYFLAKDLQMLADEIKKNCPMIGKLYTGKGFGGCIRYCLEDKKPSDDEAVFVNRAELIWQNQCFGNAKELTRDFRQVANLSTRTEKPVLHIVLNPAQGDRLTKGQWIEIAEACAKEFDIADHQYMCILHKDKGTPHVHIIANRVGYDGKAASDSNSYKRMQDFCRKVEKQYGLREVLSSRAFLPASKKQLHRSDKRKQKLQSDVRQVLQKVKTFSEFKAQMKGLGYQVIKGRGVSFVDSKGVKTKGSDIGFSLAKIETVLELRHQLVKIQGEESTQKQEAKQKRTALSKPQQIYFDMNEPRQQQHPQVTFLQNQIASLLAPLFQSGAPQEESVAEEWEKSRRKRIAKQSGQRKRS